MKFSSDILLVTNFFFVGVGSIMIIITTVLNSRHLVIILIQRVTNANMFSVTRATLENHI